MYGGTFIGGPYTVTWNGTALGIAQGEQGVPSLLFRHFIRWIENTDQKGDTRLGGFYRGSRGRFMMRCQEYKAATIAAAWPFGGAQGSIPQVGQDVYNLAQALILTAVSGTPAQIGDAPASLTASKGIISADYDISLLFGPVLRELPLEMDLLPFLNGSVDALYSFT